MRRLLLLVLTLLASAAPALSQSTTVSGTITDAGGQAWFSGTVQFRFRPADSNPTAQYFWNGSPFDKSTTIPAAPLSLDGSGSFSGVSVPSNNFINPSGSTWTVQVCPAATTPCFSQNLTITGATQSVSAQIIPPAVNLNLAVPLLGSRAYADSEISGALPGTQYFNVTDNKIHVCLQTGFPPCTWSAQGTGNVTAVGTFANGDIIVGAGGTAIQDSGIPISAGEHVLSTNITPVTVSASTVSFQNLMGFQSAVAAGALNTSGKQIRIKSSGTFSPVNNTEDVALSFKLGSAGFPTLSHFIPATAAATYGWTMNALCITTTTGASGVLSCFGEFIIGGVNIGNALNSTSSPFNASATYTVDLTGTVTGTNAIAFGTASGTNTATQSLMAVEQLN
jgi:hypothetical protein